jgi:hypothetical protein
VVESGTVLKALETGIRSDAIEKVIANVKAGEDRKCALPSPEGDLSDNCHEFVVKSKNLEQC